MKVTLPLRRLFALTALAWLGAAPVTSFGALVVDSLDGDITQNEVDNFIATVRTITPAANNHGNALATHGTAVQGIRRLYEVTGNVALLDEYIRFSDAALSRRNDLPGGEGRVMWEGTVAPVWPNIAPGQSGAGYAGCESGQVAGNIAYCAYLILSTPSVWNNVVPDGNPNGYGATYKERALTYLGYVDQTNNDYLLPWFINPATLRVRKPQDPRWASNAGNQSCTAWNRQYLFIQGFLHSARCHDILQDNPSYLATYKEIVNQFATWFVSTTTYYQRGGHPVAKWYYEVPPDTHIENMGHAQHDVVGLFECFASGYTTVTSAQVKVFADTTRYVINLGSTNAWSENVDGTGTIESSLKSDFIFLSQWHRPLYRLIAESNLTANQLSGSEGAKNTGYILYMKRWMHANPVTASPAAPTALTASASNGQVTLGWSSAEVATYTVKRATTAGGPYVTVASGVDYLQHTDLGLTNGTTYYYVVSASNEVGESPDSAELAVAPQPQEYLLENVARGGTASANVQRPNENAARAFDGLTSTKWFTGGGPTTGWLQYDFGPGVAWALLRYDLSSANDVPTRDPKSWQLLGSDDGVSWTILDTRTNETFSARFQTKSYEINGSTPYRFYRLNITANNGASGIQLSELALIAKVSTPPAAPTGLAGGGGNGVAFVSWNPVTGAISYRVKRASTAAGPYTVIAGTTDTRFTDTTVVNRQTYYYVVSALNPVAESVDSSVIVATPLVHEKFTGPLIGTPGSFGNHPARTKEAAFDGNLSTFFAAPVDDGAWAGLDLGENANLVLREVRFAPRSGFSDRMTGGVFQGANSADFSDAVTFYTIPAPPTNGVMTSQVFSNQTPYRYVRYLSANGGQCNVAELEFWGIVAAAPTITSATTDSGTLGEPYHYAILATYQPGQFAATGLPPGLTLNTTEGIISGTPAVAGSFTVTLEATNFFGTGTGSLALTVAKKMATVTLAGLSQTYDGTAKPVSVTTSPEGLVVNVTYDGAASPPTNAGSYAIEAAVVDPSYQGAASGTLVVAKAPATITLGNLARVYDGAPQAVSATTNPAGLPVIVTYNGTATAPTNAGSYAVQAMVQHVNYAGAAAGTLVIAKAPATLALAPLRQSYDGTPRSVVATSNPSGLNVNVTYNGADTAPIYPGTYEVVATIADANYGGAVSETLVVTITALVRHAPTLNGMIDGSVQVLSAENLTLNSTASISGDVLVPGTPALQLNGQPVLVGTLDGPGASTPTAHRVTLNSQAVLRYLVRRVDPIALPLVAAPQPPAGSRNVVLNNSGQSAGDFATLRNLTLNGSVGAIAVPPGRYGTFIANGASSFVLGVPGASEPAVYDLQGLTLNGASTLQVVGPVILTLANGVVVNGSVGSAEHPEWLTLRTSNGGVTLNGDIAFHGHIIAPNGTVTVNGSTTLRGSVSADRLVLNSNALLEEATP